MGSRILGRILAVRLRDWAEAMKLVDDEQSGFRKGRSTADTTQIMYRIQEDAIDLRRRKERAGEVINGDEEAAARLLDLQKAYPRVNKPALWRLLVRYGMGNKCLRVLQDLHETTEYKVIGRDGESEPWIPERGLREGGATSPPLFNVYHQAPIKSIAAAAFSLACLLYGHLNVAPFKLAYECLPSPEGYELKFAVFDRG